jgi:type III restriction enzyme
MSENISRHSLVEFQLQAVDGLIAAFKRVGWHLDQQPDKRKQIALTYGVALLEAPTGSGKTLMLGRVLEGLRGNSLGKTVWFWFAPYSGLVTQSREALNEQCGSLRLRDIYTDRIAANARDGDVFLHTWDSMRANRAETRKVRQRTEKTASLEDMLADLRDAGFNIGVVIDEAHLNFGASATASANLYLDVLRPEYTLLATATPNDKKLEEFERSAGIRPENRIVIERQRVVLAGLNKEGLKLGYLKLREEDGRFIDLEQAILRAAWLQHERVKQELVTQGITVTPLMLVQVEDQVQGGEDPVKRVWEKLELAGIPTNAIRSHTSGEPDPDFHTYAYDPNVEVLIFKVAVATGFDAPRAWTLVSVRPNRGVDFGLQIVGRIMRVHPSVRKFHGQNPLLDSGYVFLNDPDSQAGLDAAADEMKAVKQGIDLVTDKLDVVVFGDFGHVSEYAFGGNLPAAILPKTPDERQSRLGNLVQQGLLKSDVLELTPEEQDNAIVRAEAVASLGNTGLFGKLPELQAPTKTNASSSAKAKIKSYKLRREELNIPVALVREELPPFEELDDAFYASIGNYFCGDGRELFALLSKRGGRAELGFVEKFSGAQIEARMIDVRLSNARIAEESQQHFEFNDSLDTRLLKNGIINRLLVLAAEQGMDAPIQDLRRAIELTVMQQPSRLHEAIKQAQARKLRFMDDLPIPDVLELQADNLTPARLGAYGVFNDDMNNEERLFAELLDSDTTGTVKWWLKNKENTKWATRIILPTGNRFFPDFAIGIQGRKNRDQIALVEIKDNGHDGRLQSDINLLKAQIRHTDYGKVNWAFREEKWVRGEFNPMSNRIIAHENFRIELLLLD